MKISQEMLKVREELLERFAQKRNLIPNNLTNEELLNNNEFFDIYKECYLINFLLLTLFEDEVSYDVGNLFLQKNNYNIDSLFENYKIDYDSQLKNFSIKIKDK